MASADILVLSSILPRQFTTYDMSSSPTLPSPSNIFKNKPSLLDTGRRPEPVPQNATASLTNISCLHVFDNIQGTDVLRSLKFGAENGYAVAPIETFEPAKAKARKSAIKKDVDLGDGKVDMNKDSERAVDVSRAKKPRKSRKMGADGETREDEKEPRNSRAKEIDGGNIAGDFIKAKTAPKRRAKKLGGERQTQLPKSQVTKPSSNSEADKTGTTKSKTVDLASKHFCSKTGDRVDPFTDSFDSGLVEAIKRRNAWTPPPITSPKTASLTTPGTSEEGSKGFNDLFGEFGFNNTEIKMPNKCLAVGAGTRKRKLVELLRMNVSASNTAPATNPPVPKKKARTLTDQATSAYADQEESTVRPAPLLHYFSYETTDGVTSDQIKVPPKPRLKGPLKGGKKPRKGTKEAPILLSPESALKQVGNQDFVFGTSSQLAREQSPTLLRDLHAAMQASNEINDDDDPFADSPPRVAIADRGNIVSSIKRNLWSAAARGTGGYLLDVEMVDLAASPQLVRHVHTAAEPRIAPAEAKPEEETEDWHNVEELEYAWTQKIASVQCDPKPVGPVEKPFGDELPGGAPRSMQLLQSSSKPSTMSKTSLPPKAVKASEPKKSTSLEMPDYGSYSTAQLAKEVASYRFKPVKNRDNMIKLLEKCWEGKQRMALGVLAANIPISSPKKSCEPLEANQPKQAETESPKRPRGRPRKDCAATSPAKLNTTANLFLEEAAPAVRSLELDSGPRSKVRTRMPKKLQNLPKQPIDDISDSDWPINPSPPRRPRSQIRSSPLQLQLSPNASDGGSQEFSPISSQAGLFRHITQAVTSAPPSKDPSNPNWHEKILLYDPIVLEDLTVWLNAGRLEKVGWDGEVDPKDVKKWCESKSICCLWKENLRGRTRTGF